MRAAVALGEAGERSGEVLQGEWGDEPQRQPPSRQRAQRARQRRQPAHHPAAPSGCPGALQSTRLISFRRAPPTSLASWSLQSSLFSWSNPKLGSPTDAPAAAPPPRPPTS